MSYGHLWEKTTSPRYGPPKADKIPLCCITIFWRYHYELYCYLLKICYPFQTTTCTLIYWKWHTTINIHLILFSFSTNSSILNRGPGQGRVYVRLPNLRGTKINRLKFWAPNFIEIPKSIVGHKNTTVPELTLQPVSGEHPHIVQVGQCKIMISLISCKYFTTDENRTGEGGLMHFPYKALTIYKCKAMENSSFGLPSKGLSVHFAWSYHMTNHYLLKIVSSCHYLLKLTEG